MAKSMTREAIVKRLTAYHAKTVAAGVNAREDIMALAAGVSDAEFATLVTAHIGAMRLGRVIPVADRVAIIKDWRSKTRVGGKIGIQNVADALGVVISTVSVDANSDDDANAVTTPKTEAEEIGAVTKRVTKITAKVESPNAEIVKAIDALEAEVRKLRAKVSG